MLNETLLPISAIVLAHRDDHRLHQALASLSWAEEIILMTHQIQLKKTSLPTNVKQIIEVTTPTLDFAEVRNQALSKAKSEWVFFLDSDEVVSPSLIMSLPELISRDAAYAFHRVDYFLGQPLQHGEVGQVYKIRLAKKGKISFERAVHEVALVTDPVVERPEAIFHFAHQSISEFWQKIMLYSQLDAELRKKNGQHFSVLTMILYPVGKFVVNYFFKLGCLDGWRGLVYALLMSFHSLFVRVQLYEK